MGDEAASGGYYVAVTGDPIIAYPNTLTGSIGVIFARFNLHGLYRQSRRERSDSARAAATPTSIPTTSPLSDDERKKIAGQIDAFYRAFVGHVADGRKKPFDQIEPLAQGRVWLGAQAKQNGLVDQLGGLDRAIEVLKQQAHMSPSDRVTLVPYPGRRSVFDLLFSRADPAAEVEMRLDKVLGRLPWQILSQHGFLKLMPYSIDSPLVLAEARSWNQRPMALT